MKISIKITVIIVYSRKKRGIKCVLVLIRLVPLPLIYLTGGPGSARIGAMIILG